MTSTDDHNTNTNRLAHLRFVQIFLIMLCGLVLKNQDLIDDESFDKKNLGYVLIAVNVLVLLIAVGLAVIQFRRSNEDDYQSDNAVAIMKRGIESQNTRSSDNSTDQGRGSSMFDYFSGLRKSVVRNLYGNGGGEKNKIEEDGGNIELGDLYNVEDGIAESVNPMEKNIERVIKKEETKKKTLKVGRAIGAHFPTPPPMPKQVTAEEAKYMEPPPIPTKFTTIGRGGGAE